MVSLSEGRKTFVADVVGVAVELETVFAEKFGVDF